MSYTKVLQNLKYGKNQEFLKMIFQILLKNFPAEEKFS